MQITGDSFQSKGCSFACLTNELEKYRLVYEKVHTDHLIWGVGLPIILHDSWTREPSKPDTSVSSSYTTGACSGSSVSEMQNTKGYSKVWHCGQNQQAYSVTNTLELLHLRVLSSNAGITMH